MPLHNLEKTVWQTFTEIFPGEKYKITILGSFGCCTNFVQHDQANSKQNVESRCGSIAENPTYQRSN
jgi:hypothetical protein